MLTEERRKIIQDIIKTDKIVRLQELIKLTNASESTLRRDLQDMEDSNLLIRIHGGAKAVSDPTNELSISERGKQNQAEKDQIAQFASTKISDGQTVYLDAGTSVSEIIKYLKPLKNCHFYTNGIDTASILSDFDIESYILPGKIKTSTKAIVGAVAMEALESLNFDIAFMGTNGFSLDKGLTTPDPEEAAIKGKIISRAKQSFALADANKLNKNSFVKFANLMDVELITSTLSEPNRSQLLEITEIHEVN